LPREIADKEVGCYNNVNIERTGGIHDNASMPRNSSVANVPDRRERMLRRVYRGYEWGKEN